MSSTPEFSTLSAEKQNQIVDEIIRGNDAVLVILRLFYEKQSREYAIEKNECCCKIGQAIDEKIIKFLDERSETKSFFSNTDFTKTKCNQSVIQFGLQQEVMIAMLANKLLS